MKEGKGLVDADEIFDAVLDLCSMLQFGEQRRSFRRNEGGKEAARREREETNRLNPVEVDERFDWEVLREVR